MQLDFSNCGPQHYRVYRKLFTELLSKTLSILKLDDYVLVSVVLVSDQEIAAINAKYRNIPSPTDVISFAFLDDEKEIRHNEYPLDLGEIYISYERAKQQAHTLAHSFQSEMMFLFVHGLLHLLRYDHQSAEDEAKMCELQKMILQA